MADAARQAVVAEWLAEIVAALPVESGGFIVNEADPFRNPIGGRLRLHLPPLLDWLLDGQAATEVTSALRAVVRVTALHHAANGTISCAALLEKILSRRLGQGYTLELVEKIAQLSLLEAAETRLSMELIAGIRSAEKRRATAVATAVLKSKGMR